MANDMTDAERMTKYETQMENLITVVTRMDTKIDAWQANFVPKELLAVELKARDKEIDSLYKKFDDINTEKNTNKSTAPLWAAAIISVIDLIMTIAAVWTHVK